MLKIGKRLARRRPGFTLIELLVVIAIIGLLVGLTAVAVMRLTGVQQSANTRSELSRLQTEIQKQVRAFEDKVSTEPIPSFGSPTGNAYYQVVVPMAGNEANRAQVIWRKLRLKQAFPNCLNEALNPTPMPPLPYYTQTLGALGYTTANTSATSPAAWESSACLLLALERGEEGGGVTPEILGVNSFVKSNPTPNGGTIKSLIDGWGNPIAFSRWPTGSAYLNPNGAQTGANNDAADPSGLLVSTTWQGTAGYTQFKTYCHDVPAHTAGKEATTYRLFPLMASAGPDGQFGLDLTGPYFTFKTTNAGQAADNLYPTLAPAK